MITNRRNSDPQLEDLKGLAVAFINQATSKVEKKKNRNLVAKHFRLKAKRKADWESLAEKGNLFVPDYSTDPYLYSIDEKIIKWAGLRYQGLLKRNFFIFSR